MSGPMPPAQSGGQRGMFGIPHGADYNPRLDPFAGGGGGQWRSGMGHGQANVPMPMPRPAPGRAGAVGPGGVPRTYTGQTQQIPATLPPKSQAQVPQGKPNPRLTPQDVDPSYKPKAGPVPIPRPRPPAAATAQASTAPAPVQPPAQPPAATTATPKQAPPPLPRPRPGEPPASLKERSAVPPQINADPRAEAIRQLILRQQERGRTTSGQNAPGDVAPPDVPPKGNTSQAPPSKGGVGSDAAAAARARGETSATTPSWPQRSNVAAKGSREDITPVDPNVEIQAKYEQQKRELVEAILKANAPRPSNWTGSQQVGINIYNPLPPPTIPRSGPNAGQIKPGPHPTVNRAAKDSSIDFYRALNVQPGDKAAANRAIQALIKQREIAPASITVAQDRILASIGKSDAFNLSIEPKAVFERLKPTQPERVDIPERKKGPMDTQFQLHPEFQNRTDEWRPGVAVPERDSTADDYAERVTKQHIDRLGDPPKEGGKTTPTQKDVTQAAKEGKTKKDKFGRDVIPSAKGGGEAEVEGEDEEETTTDTGGQDP